MNATARPARRGRRTLIIVLSLVVLICVGAPVALGGWLIGGTINTFGKVDFTNRLAIPPLAPSHLDSAGRRVFDLQPQPGHHDFGSGHSADTLGYSGDYLGPTLRASRGEQVVVNVHNGLDEATTVHWHGMHLPAMMDGGPHEAIAAGANWSPTWKIDQPAATLWYHPHPHGSTADQVYRGLGGLFILDDPQSTGLGLPSRYGVDDVPVVVQDRTFSGDRLNTGNSRLSGTGILGDQIVVNGTLAPYLEVTSTLVRLRVLNASNARAFDFGFADDRTFAMIASDGGLLTRPFTTNRIQLSPGERAEIVVAMRSGERVVLRSYRPVLGGGLLNDHFDGGKDQFDVLQLRAAATLSQVPQLPGKLVDVPRMDPAQAVTTRHLELGDNMINKTAMAMTRVDTTVTVNTTEVWELSNLDGAPHDFHVHDVQFQVLSIGGNPPPEQLAGWKDTVFLTPGVITKIILRFADYPDPRHAYMYHCHLLFHEDSGMMGQFVVVQPGQTASLAPDEHGH